MAGWFSRLFLKRQQNARGRNLPNRVGGIRPSGNDPVFRPNRLPVNTDKHPDYQSPPLIGTREVLKRSSSDQV